jgi:hypothetical protein
MRPWRGSEHSILDSISWGIELNWVCKNGQPWTFLILDIGKAGR